MSDARTSALADNLFAECEDRTRELSGTEYVECYDELISALQASVNAKTEEMRKAGRGIVKRRGTMP